MLDRRIGWFQEMDFPKDKRDKLKLVYQNDKLPFDGTVVEIQPIDTMENEELKTRSYRDQGDGFYEKS